MMTLIEKWAELRGDAHECGGRVAELYIGFKECYDDLVEAQARIEKLQAVRDDISELVNDGEPHEMGGPFIAGNWVLGRMNEALEAE